MTWNRRQCSSETIDTDTGLLLLPISNDTVYDEAKESSHLTVIILEGTTRGNRFLDLLVHIFYLHIFFVEHKKLPTYSGIEFKLIALALK